MADKPHVSFSEISNYLSCRRKWQWRKEYTAPTESHYLSTGKLFHLAVDLNRGVPKAVQVYREQNPGMELPEEQITLVQGMYDHFVEWEKRNAPTTMSVVTEEPFYIDLDSEIRLKGIIDRVASEENPLTGKREFWVHEFKTVGQFSPEEAWLFSEQIPGYILAADKLIAREEIVGCKLFEIQRSYPKDSLKILKSGEYSLDKSQRVTYATAKKLLSKMNAHIGLDMSPKQMTFLEAIRETETPLGDRWLRRFEITKTPDELESFRRRTCVIAHEMLDDPTIYPAPDKQKCMLCEFRGACEVAESGGDWEGILEREFNRKGQEPKQQLDIDYEDVYEA